ncbi:hypothetical protein ABIB57_004244 [Devosia sp. UYZn731]
MIDSRDIGEITAIELMRREVSSASLPLDRFSNFLVFQTRES